MRVVLDTHFILWLMLSPARISKGEQAIIEAVAPLDISVVSLWEIRVKWNTMNRHGERKGEVSPAQAMIFADKTAMRIEPLKPRDWIAPLDPPLDHKDPFDEMLLTHAQQLGARLLTRDRRLAEHPIALVA